jgi:hypothetical protein
MESLYFFCAAAAGVILLMQFVLGLLGMGHHLDFHDGSADFHLDHADGMEGDHDLDHGEGADHADHAGAWFVGILSFRAIVSSVMMFGLAGLSAQKMYEPSISFGIAAACGIGVLFGVAYLLKMLYGFASDGTVRDLDTIGTTGSVYVSIPANNQGKGKVTVVVKGRTMEYEAMTEGESLSTGTLILVVDVPTPDVLGVVRDDETPTSQGTSDA